jgi:hypothetical protein
MGEGGMTAKNEASALSLPRKVIEGLLSGTQEALSFRKGRTLSVGNEDEARAAYITLHNAASFADETLRRSDRAGFAGGSWVVSYRSQENDVGFWKTFTDEDAALAYLRDRLAHGAAEVSMTRSPGMEFQEGEQERAPSPSIEVTENDVAAAVERAARRMRVGASDIVTFTDQELELPDERAEVSQEAIIELCGSHGAIEASALTGEIIRYDEADEAYRMHVRVDIDEFILRTGEYPEGSYDILDFALFNRDGTYAPAELERATEGWEDFFAAADEAQTSD